MQIGGFIRFDDSLAARALGMTTAWINSSGSDWPAELAPAALQFTDLAGLAASLIPVATDAVQ